ncbi:TfoX/Sxy family protein [Candidatus Kaiserbacteria bacterium]|nr:TfoX/Sxy family protein [Candidatus Kaiserbacteria bacterium]
MARDNEFHDYVMGDVLSDITEITSRAMFGGWGIYKDKKIFALIADGELFFKVGDSNRADYESRGSRPFQYTNNGKTYSMSYWLLPEEIMQDRDELVEWVEKAARVGGEQSQKKKRR